MENDASRLRPRDAPAQPPGTVKLFSQDGELLAREGAVILTPTPSDDPDDPLSWSMLRKGWNYGLLMAMTVAVFTALGVQPVFWPQMLAELDVTLDALTDAQAAQLVGLAGGCVVFIPFAAKYGRRPVYIVSTALVMASVWWSAVMKTPAEIVLTNVLMGLAGATNETAVQMSIRDLFFVHQRGTANGLYLIAVMSGTFLTPMAAGAQALRSGWRSSYLTLAGFMTALSLLFALTFEETKFVPVVRGGRRVAAHDEACELGRAKLEPAAPGVAAPPARSPFPRRLRLRLVTRTDESLWRTLYRPAQAAWFPHVVLTSLELASGVCWVVVMASVTSIVFSRPPYGFNAAQIGFMFGGPLVGSALGSLYGGWMADWAILRLAARNGGVYEPEMRLWLAPLPAVLMSGGLALFGVTADRGMHWIYPSIGGAAFAAGFGAIADICCTLVIDAFPNLVPLTFVAVAFFRNAISIAGPFSIAPWMKVASVSSIFVTGMAVSAAIHLVAVPVVFWGRRMRTRLAPRYHSLSEQIGT